LPGAQPWAGPKGLVLKSIPAITIGTRQYNALEVEVWGDPRDLFEGFYALEAWRGKPTNRFKFTSPRMAAHFHNADSKAIYDVQTTNLQIREANGIGVTAYQTLTPEDRLESIILEFPRTIQYSDAPFLDATTDDLTSLTIRSIQGGGFVNLPYLVNGILASTSDNSTKWQLVDVASGRAIQRDAVRAAPTAAQQMAAMFGAVNIGGATNAAAAAAANAGGANAAAANAGGANNP
jgi:hypothetical protein